MEAKASTEFSALYSRLCRLEDTYLAWMDDPEGFEWPPESFWNALVDLLEMAAETATENEGESVPVPVGRALESLDRLDGALAEHDDGNCVFPSDPDLADEYGQVVPHPQFWGAYDIVRVQLDQWKEMERARPIQTAAELLQETGNDYRQTAKMLGWFHEGADGKPDYDQPAIDLVRQELNKPGSVSKERPPKHIIPRRSFKVGDNLRNRDEKRAKAAAQVRAQAAKADACPESSLQLLLDMGWDYLDQAAGMLKRDVESVQLEWLAYIEDFEIDMSKLTNDRKKHILLMEEERQALQASEAVADSEAAEFEWMTDDELRGLCAQYSIVTTTDKRGTMVRKLIGAKVKPPVPKGTTNGQESGESDQGGENQAPSQNGQGDAQGRKKKQGRGGRKGKGPGGEVNAGGGNDPPGP